MPEQRARGLLGILTNTSRDLGDISDRRRMAEMAAQRFDSIGGDQAAYWAKSLRANPRTALGMASQYGGFAQIEGGLLSARAAGEAEEAQAQAASHMTPIELNALQTGGFGALKQLRESQKTKQEMDREPEAREATARVVGNRLTPLQLQVYQQHGPQGLKQFMESQGIEAENRMRDQVFSQMRGLGSGGEPAEGGSGDGVGSGMSLSTIGALGMIEPEMARAQLAIRDARRKPYTEQIKAFRVAAKPVIQSYQKMSEDWTLFRGQDWANPANDARLVKQFVGMVEPGLQVTTAEGEQVEVAAESRAGALTQMLLRTLTNAGRFTPTTRRLMAESIEQGFQARMGTKQNFIDSLRTEITESVPSSMRGEERSLIGESGPFKRLEEFMANPIDFDAIGPALGDAELLPEDKSDLETGVVYVTRRGRARWNGNSFDPVGK